jgi:very-short-patch-repair endonuclease
LKTERRFAGKFIKNDMKPKTPPHDLFTTICKSNIGIECVKEFRFHPTRKWRFDYAFVEQKIAVEVDGGVWIGGRHNRASGYVKDLEKFNAATALGWVVLKFTPEQLYRSATFDLIKETIKNRVA